jgi:hypothetical protein
VIPAPDFPILLAPVERCAPEIRALELALPLPGTPVFRASALLDVRFAHFS